MSGHRCKALTAALAIFLSPAAAFAGSAEVTVDGIRVWADPEKTRAVLDLTGSSEYELFTLDNPERVVVDLPSAEFEARFSLNPETSGLIQRVRYGKPDKQTLRVVLDVSENARTKSFLLKPTGTYGHRLVIDLFPASKSMPTDIKRADAPPEPNRDIVIAVDAGHGGEDPGAIGKNRTREKDVVLQIARKLKESIDAEPGMRAILTRDGDYYIAHRERYERARRARADLFLSIHADAFRDRGVKGSKVFVLSQRGASSEMARLLADDANRSDLVGGVSLDDKDDMLASVLLDLSQSATMEASDAVASEVFSALKGTGRVRAKSVGRANFLVLKSPDVPSLLVETAFISNPSEEKRLTHRDFQQQMADTIKRGVVRYFYNSPPPGTWVAANREGLRHVVKRGDTLGEIASRYHVSVGTIRQANNLRNDVIHPGEELLIPRG